MAVSCIQSAGAHGPAGVTTAVWPSLPKQGNLLVAGVEQSAGGIFTLTSPPSASDWNALTNATDGTESARLFWKRADASEPMDVGVNTGSAATGIAIAEYGVVTAAALGAENSNAGTIGTNPILSPAVTPPSGKQAVVVALLGSYDVGVTITGVQINGSSTGVTTRYAAAPGGGMVFVFADLFVASTSGSYQAKGLVSSGAPDYANAIAVFDVTSGASNLGGMLL